MSFRQIRLIPVDQYFPQEWEQEFLFRALEVEGRSRALEVLKAWQEHQFKDYKRILKAAKLVGSDRPVTNPDYVKKDDAGTGIYEMRAPGLSARLMYYYAAPHDGLRKQGVVILLDFYWKTKNSKREQERVFDCARRLMELAEANLEGLYNGAFGRVPVQRKGKRNG